MPFPIAITSPQKTTLRTGGYWQRTIACLNPNDVVFRAQAAETINSAPFITFTWDSADVGAFGSVLEGMVCYISATTDIRSAKYRGRVRLAPSATEFYIDENATILNDNDYIIVVRDADFFARVRRGDLVDGSIAYHNLPPMIAGLPSTLCLYDADADGNVSYTTVQTGVAVASGATISSWLHTISGTGTVTFTSGTSTSQNPTVRLQAGFHYLWRVRVTDSNGVQSYQFMQVYAVNRTLSAPANTSVVTGSIESDIDNGYTASLTGYADLSTLIDRTHCAVFSIERFGDNSSTPIVTNVLMNGRIRSDSLQTQGNEEAGQVQQVTFSVEGITSYLQRLRIPSDIVRASAAPDEWGEMVAPNPYRMAVYAMWAYTTLTTICSFSAESGNFADWRTGAEPVAIDGGYAADILTGILWDRIKAQCNYAPSGEIFLARNLNYLSDRSAVVTVMDFLLQDLREFGIDRDSSRVTSQVVAYGGVFESASNQIVLYIAQSPSIVYGDAPEPKELTRELLEFDSTATEAGVELSARAGNHYAFENPRPLNSVVFYDSNAWLIAANYLRYTFTLPASTNTLGIPYTTADYWWLQRVSIGINADGSIEASGEFVAETEFDDAQQLAGLLPNNLENLNPGLPVLPNDPAFPTDPLELYPTDDPGIDDLQPIGGFSAGQGFSPFPPDISSEMTEKQGKPRCFTMAVNFRNPNNTTSTKTSLLGTDYLITLQGFSVYSTNEWQQTFNFVGGNANGWAARTIGLGFGATFAAAGVEPINSTSGGQNHRAVSIGRDIPVMTTITEISVLFDFVKGTYVDTSFGAYDIGEFDPIVSLEFVPFTATVTGNNQLLTWNGSLTTDKNISVFIRSARYAGVPNGNVLVKQVTMRGTGANPFDGTPGTALSCDAFYTFDPTDAQGVTAQLYGATEGLMLDNALLAAADIPPFNPAHKYVIPFDGTNNLLLARMEFADYSPKQNRNLMIEVCPVAT